jgi:phosphodiesterase/alkaline phosphatase D-like protein
LQQFIRITIMKMQMKGTVLLVLLLFSFLTACDTKHLFVGSGIKIGEITESSAIAWMRLTKTPGQNEEGLIPGAVGEVRLRYGKDKGLQDAVKTEWLKVDSVADFSVQMKLAGLEPGTRYYYQADVRTGPFHRSVKSETFSFQTAPPEQAREGVRFQVTTGQDLRADSTYYFMAQHNPHFLVATGDNVYYDGACNATTVELAYQCYQLMYGMPFMKKYYEHVGGYFEKDDHDYRFNDADPYQTEKAGDGGRQSEALKNMEHNWLTHEEGIMVFKQVFPMDADKPTYKSFRWGKGVQIWLLEGRDYRSANSDPDGPYKTIWGAEQKEWLKKTLKESDADWRIVISPTPIIGPDRPSKTDNHANKRGFWTEGQEFLDFIMDEGLTNVVLMCGDRHWQYHSIDQRNGRNIPEFSCGPTCNEHTQRVITPEISDDFEGVLQPYGASLGGYLNVEYQPDGSLTCTFYDEKGKELYQHAMGS